MNDRVNEYIRAWIGKADNDLKNAELVLAARDENSAATDAWFWCRLVIYEMLALAKPNRMQKRDVHIDHVRI